MKDISIEIGLRYDLNLGYIRFSEFRDELGDELHMFGRYETNYNVIGDCDRPAYKWADLKRMKKGEMCDLLGLHGALWHGAIHATRLELMWELREITLSDYYQMHYEEERWYDLDTTFVVRGYSQGDAIRVKILDKKYSHLTAEYLHNIFYCHPISGSVMVMGSGGEVIEEYYFSELVEDEYGIYDRDDIIEYVENGIESEYKDAIIQEMKKLPTTIYTE